MVGPLTFWPWSVWLWRFILYQQGSFTLCCVCGDCEPSCCFSESLLSLKTSNSKHDWTALRRSQTVVVPVIFISGRSLCISLPLGVTLLIFSHPACPSSSVSSWRFDSVTAVERCLQSCGGGDVSRSEMSVLAPLIAPCVGVRPRLCEFKACVFILEVCLCVAYWISKEGVC